MIWVSHIFRKEYPRVGQLIICGKEILAVSSFWFFANLESLFHTYLLILVILSKSIGALCVFLASIRVEGWQLPKLLPLRITKGSYVKIIVDHSRVTNLARKSSNACITLVTIVFFFVLFSNSILKTTFHALIHI
jgi:hypothetical protein